MDQMVIEAHKPGIPGNTRKKAEKGIPVFGFRSMKEMKKKLKRKRRPIWSLGMLAGVFLAASAAGIGGAALIGRAAFDAPAFAVSATPPAAAALSSDKPAARTDDRPATTRDSVLQRLDGWNGQVEVMLHRTYWCGEERRLLGHLTTGEAAELLKSHRDWDASFDKAGRLSFVELSSDKYPACRQTAYIGMDEGGNLSLFDGPPRKDNVVRTFFQLDIRSLESSLPKERLRELERGIRVVDLDECNSVLSSFSDYASRHSEGVMQQQR